MASSGGLPKSLVSRVFTVLYKRQVRKALARARKGVVRRSLLLTAAVSRLQPWGRRLSRAVAAPKGNHRRWGPFALWNLRAHAWGPAPLALCPLTCCTTSCCVLKVKTRLWAPCSWGRSWTLRLLQLWPLSPPAITSWKRGASEAKNFEPKFFH